ncbi:obscurin isoform X2 [Tachysurus fulvidraco]|uniref:obscurin isoform X2 n=1 Tax=Tachysurus fulvidraco TaxID=1234273 RepID=UPI001FF073AA|nr:obscurin isoform X2 [Tachysurus fulvidraco]
MDVFGGAPRFLAYPRPVVVQSGTDAVLKCQISGDPRPAVVWERNNEKIHPGGKYRLFEDGNVYNLIITVVTAEDSGQYICKAKNSIGETYAAATLKVEGEAQEMELREENKPRFLIKPLSTRVGRGEDAVFSCKLWGKPRPEVVWEKDGKKLNEIFESTHFSVGYQDGGWFQLKIFKTRAPDGGVYTCKARNEFGESLAGAVLLVDAGPGHEDEGNRNGYTNGHWKANQGKQRSSRHVVTRLKEGPLPTSAKVKMFAVTEGKHAKFRCYVTGKPKPEIIWRKDGRIILSGRRYLLYEDREGYFTLKVLYCKQQDNGVYVCAASNTAGQTLSAVHLFVKEPPVRFKQPLNDLEVWEQDLAILECEVPEDSVPITWYLEDRRLQPGAKYGMEEWGTKRRLTIRDMGVDDDGIYLCEMPDGGRSIAEVTVKGTIVRKLPRKVDVLEGENAAFCVEVEEEEMDIHWYKDGTELRETHQTIIKSFGRTHILVFVNTTPQDSGLVIFYVGRSKTSSQLRVKAIRQCPPSCPVGVQINTERANAALLSWVTAQDCRKNPPSGYILERQEIGSPEWLQCLTTDSATSVEILGDSVPCEADYRFRICSINKYGRSGYVEFPRAVHLVPVAKIQAPLQDALVPEGQDACFSIELSASVIGTWFWNGTQIQDDERFLIRRSRTHQSLRIRGVRDTDNGAEITFIAYGIRDSAALYIQAPLVKFTPLSEIDRNKFVEVGNPIVLYCELSDPEAQVRWYKNGAELHSVEGLHIQSEGTMRRIVIQSAEFSHSGVYSCDAIDDVIRFNVEVEAPPVRFIALSDMDANQSIEAGCPILLQCELSEPSAQVSWYKDETKLLPQNGLDFLSDGTKRALVIEKADFCHSGVYSCKTKGVAVQFNVEIKAPPVRLSAGPETERRKCIEAGGTIVLQCEISDSSGQVRWFKDGKQICTQSGVDFQSEDCIRRLIIESAALSHSGVYRCATKDDIVEFQVEIKAVPVWFSTVPEVEKNKCIEAGSCFELRCEVSDPTAVVHWYKDETEILTDTGWDIQAEGTLRMLVVQSAEPSHSGLYSCNMVDDSVQFTVDIKDPPVKFSAFPGVVKNQFFEAGYPTELHCEISDPPAKVCWYEDGVALLSKSQPHIKMEDTRRKLALKAEQPSESGWHDPQRNYEVIQYYVQDEASPLKLLDVPDVEKSECSVESISTAQHCKILDSTEYNYRLKDEEEILSPDGIEPEPQIKWEVPIKTLNIKSSETPDNGINRPRMPDDHTQFIADKAEQSHSEVYKGETYDDTVQCTVDMKAESFPEIAKTNIVMESLGVTEGSEVAKIKIIKESLGFSQEATIPVLAKVNMEGLSFTDVPELTKSEILEESLSFTAVPDLAKNETTKESLSFTELLKLSKNKNLKESLSFTAVPDFTKTKNTKESLSFTDGSNVSKSKSLEESLSFIADPDSAKTEHNKECLSFTEGSNVSKNKSPKESLSFIADPVLAKTENIQKSLSLTDRSDFKYSELNLESLSLSTVSKLEKNENSKESLSFANCPEFIFQESLSFTAVPELLMKENMKETSLKQVQHTKSDSDASFCSFKDEELPQPQCVKQETARSFQEDDRSYFKVQEICTDDDVLAYKVDHEAQDMSDEKAFEAACFTDLGEVYEKKAQIFGHGDVSVVQQQDGKNMTSYMTSKEQFAQLLKTPHKEMLTAETKNQSVMYQDQVKAPSPKPVKFAPLPETGRTKTIEHGMPLVLQCEISDPDAPVCWFKDGIQLQMKHGLVIQSEDCIRRLVVPTTELGHTGVYNCEAIDDVIKFKVYVKAARLNDSTLTETQKNEMTSNEADHESVEQKEAIYTTDQVCWYRQEQQQIQDRPHASLAASLIQSKEIRSEEIKSADLSDSGEYNYETNDTNILSTVDPPVPPVMFSTVTEVQRNISAVVGKPFILECVVSDVDAHVRWYKDGNELSSEAGVLVQSEGTIRKLSVQSAELSHSGTYDCKTDADAVTFTVDIEATSTSFKPLSEMERNRSGELDSPSISEHKISDSENQVCWYKDGTELHINSGINIQRDENVMKLPFQSTELSDTGHFICGSPDDAVPFKIDSQASPVRFSALPEVARNKFIEAGCPIILQCEISKSATQVSWLKDGVPLHQETGLVIKSEGTMRALIIQSAELKHSGMYSCEAGDDHIAFRVDVAASPVTFTPVPETEKTKSFEAGSPIILQCEISEPTTLVQWYKDGTQLFPQSGVFFQSEHTMRTLVILSATFSHSGVYSCNTADDISEFYVDIKAPPVTFAYVPEEELHKNVLEQDNLVLCCEVSRSNAATQWYKDGVEIQTNNKVTMETDHNKRTLIIQSVQKLDAGTYTCRAGGSALIFKVNVREPPVMIIYPKEDVHLDRHVPEEIVLSCELSRPNGKVTWLKDGQKLQESENMKFKTEGPYRRLKILHSKVEDSGEYVCDTADDSKFFYLSIKEPPVRIVSPSQSQMELCQQMSERMVLSCEISRANAPVRWYRNGLEVEENNNLILEVDGVYRRLIIPETTVSDSAEYVCDTVDDSVTFFVNIAEPPVRFIRPRKMAYEVERFVGETIVLDCQVSRSNAEVIWKKNGEEIEESSNITIIEDGCTRQLTIHSSRVEDTGQYLCDAKDDVMDFSVKVNETPLKFLHKSDIITHRHFSVSDDIVLKCELSRANGVVCWYKDKNRIVANDHFTFEEQGTFRSLIILNAEIGDTGEYMCDAKDDEIVFNVTVQEVPVSILFTARTPEHRSLVAGNELILECEVSRESASVQWLCNGRVLQPDARTRIERRGTTRKLVLSNLHVSDSGEYTCDAIDDKMNTMVTVQEPPFKFIKKEEINIAAYEEESVTLCALVNRDNGSVQWSKGGETLSDHRFYATSDGRTHYLTINNLKKSDAGEYECDVGTDKAHFSVQVKAMKVKFSKPLQNLVGLKGSDAVLRCELHTSKGDVQWLKNNQEITPNRHCTIRADGQERSLTIHNLTDDDAGEYTCESKDERTCATVVVKTPRVVEFIAELNNITVMEGEDATFKCVVSPEDAKMVWCMNGWPITSNERFKISSNGLCHMLCIKNCQVSDSCKMTAEAEGMMSKAILRVQEKQVLFTKKMESVVAEEFGEAILQVELSLECGEVQWMRQGVVIHPGPKFTLKQSGLKCMLTIHNLALSDRGTYSCETLHDRTQASLSVEPRKVKIRKGLSEIQTFERETASFEVELTHSNVEGMWLKDGNRLKSNNHWRMTTNGHVHSLTIVNLSLEDTGTYTFSTENARSSARLTIKETPVTILKKLEDKTFPEGTGATLECEVSKYNVTVKWTKNGEELKSGKNHRMYSMGRKYFLQIVRCELGDSGLYVCDAGDATTSCSVEVYERELEVLNGLEDLDIQEDQNAVFMCEVSLDDVPGEWFKNGEKIKPTSTIKIRQEGNKHFLLMCNVKEEDSGEIKFVAKNVESKAHLEVEKLPVNIVKPLQDKTAQENTRVLLDCTVSNPRCSIRWYQGRNVILPSERFEICSEGCYRKLVIQEVALEDAGMYSVQVGENTSSARLTVEAQPILITQELQDVEVSAPEEACFVCEVSVPLLKTPIWTLNGDVLKPGPKVLLEKMGTVHKLTLKHTSEDINGVVVFDSGKAKSTANLYVKK